MSMSGLSAPGTLDDSRAALRLPAARVRSFHRWFIPDAALTFGLTTMLALFFLSGGATSLFNDSDTGWHISNGARIISTGLLPRVDPFSFTKAGQPWMAWEWGSDVLMAAVFRFSGLGGVALMYGLCIGVSVWLWFRLNHAAGGNFLLACALFVPMLSTTSLHWLARPHVIGWLFMLGTVLFCERMPARLRWRDLVLVAITAALWSNLHASFFFGPLIALIYAGGAHFKLLIWEAGGRRKSADIRLSERSYVWLAIAATAGTLANPAGWRLHGHVIWYLASSGLLDHIGEFQSFNFHESQALQVMLTLAICVAGGVAALTVRRPERFLLSMALTAMALHSVRALPVAALLLLPLANGSITPVLAHARNLVPRFRHHLDELLEYGDRLEAIGKRFRGFALIPLIALLIFASIRNRAAFPASVFPVAASSIVATLPLNSRILAPDTFGGYLIYRFNGERKVFVDGRSDFYGMGFLSGYLRLLNVTPDWREEFNRWNFTNALLPAGHRLIPALEANGWREIYRDNTAVLLSGKARL